MAQVHIDRNCNDVVAHLAGVKAEVKATAEGGAARAKAILGAHHHSGDAKITLTRGKLDWFVNLDDTAGDKAAAAIEFGHVTRGGRSVQGVHAISGAF